jgi:hypothetical protein
LLGSFCSTPHPLFLFLLFSAAMKILNHNTNKHVEHKETHQENESNEVQESPLRIVLYWLKTSKSSN